MPRKLTQNEFIERSSIKHNFKYDYSLCEYEYAQSKVKIICPKGHIFEQKACDHLNGRGCRFCEYEKTGLINKISLEEVKERLFKKYGDKFQYDFSNFKNLNTRIKCFCPDHGSFEIRVNSLLKGRNCRECKGTGVSKGTTERFIEQSRLVHNGYYDYSKSIYTTNKNKLVIICSKHGEFLQSPNSHMRGQGCPSCKMSKGEKLIRTWLSNNNIKFKPQHSFDDYKRRYYDFYLPDYNMCIEYDGELHYVGPKRLGGEEKLEKRKLLDKEKTEYCAKNNIKIIRIPYFEINNISNILERDISPLPDKQ